MAARRSLADSVVGEGIVSDATMDLRFLPATALCAGRNKENVHHGISLRNLRQEAVLRHERLALAPSHQAPLESEHPARARTGGRDSDASERLHRLSSFGQDHQTRATHDRFVALSLELVLPAAPDELHCV